MDSEGRLSLAIVLTLALVAVAVTGLAAADPPDDPDHGVNETTFPVLWSADQDGNVSSGGDATTRPLQCGNSPTGAARKAVDRPVYAVV